MAQMDASRRTALTVDEAALLPAQSGIRMCSAALRETLRQSDEISRLQTGAFVSGRFLTQAPVISVNPGQPLYRMPGSRAALHQVMRQVGMPYAVTQQAPQAARTGSTERTERTETPATAEAVSSDGLLPTGSVEKQNNEENGLNWLNTLAGPGEEAVTEAETTCDSPWLGW